MVQSLCDLDLIQEPQNCTDLNMSGLGASFPFKIGWFLREKAMSYLVLYQVWVCDRDWFRGLSFSLKWSMEIQTDLKLFERVTKLEWYELGAPGGFLCYHKGRACPIMMSTERTVELRDGVDTQQHHVSTWIQPFLKLDDLFSCVSCFLG